jgi:hypothetical protein
MRTITYAVIRRKKAPAKRPATAAATRTRKVIKKAPAAGLKLNGISSAAVHKATGRTWEEWLPLLDKTGAKKLPHREIAEVVAGKFAVRPWWSQMVTVGYEQARGLREKHQTAKGYQVSGS